MRGPCFVFVLSIVAFTGATSCTNSPSVSRRVGPGLGNLTYAANEVFAPVSFVDQENGVPASNGVIRMVKPFGTNVAAMWNGYLAVVFASDSGVSGGGWLFYDVSDPREPVLVHRAFELFADGHEEGLELTPFDGETGRFREAHAIGFAMVGARDLALLHTAAGVEIWDLTDVTRAHRVSSLDLPGVGGGDYEDVAWQLAWQGSYAYVSSASRGVFVVDTRDPAHPRLATRRDGGPNPIPPSELGGFRVGPIFAVGNELVLSTMDTAGAFARFDVSEPTEPRMLASVTDGVEGIYATCYSGDRLAVAVRGESARIAVYDLTDPFSFRSIGERIAVPFQLYCAMQDDLLFEGNENDVVAIDTRGESEYRVVGQGTLGRDHADHGQVSPMANLMYIGNDHGTGSAFIPHRAAPDRTPPRVRYVSPADGDTHQAATTRIGLMFSDAIDNLSVVGSAFEVRSASGSRVRGRVSFTGSAMNFAPDEPLVPGTTYEVRAPSGGLRDVAGNAIAEDFVSTFTVSPLDGEGALDVALAAPATIEVGQEATFVATVEGEGPVALAFRFGDSGEFTPFGSALDARHTYALPGHVRVFVKATNGVRTAVASAAVTVHRPIVPARSSSSSSLALDEASGRLYVANRDHGTLTRIDLATLEPIDELPVGSFPSAVVAVGAGRAVVTARDEDAVVLVADDGSRTTTALAHGAAPCGIVFGDDGNVLVTESGPGDLVRRDLQGAELARVHVGPGVCGLALTPGGEVLVTEPRARDATGKVHVLHATDLSPIRVVPLAADTTTVDAEDRARGVPTFLGAPAPTPDGAAAFVPAVQSNVLRGTARDGLALTHESTVRAILPELDLALGTERSGRRIDWNDRAHPTDAVVTPLGDYVFVTLLASNSIGIVDAYDGAKVGELREVGRAPRGLALSADGERLFVDLWLDRAVAVFDVSALTSGGFEMPIRLATVDATTTEPLAADVLLGKRIFHFAGDPRMSRDGYLACVSCHVDGSQDGLTWDFTDRGEGLRNTIDLRGREGLAHGAVHWSANFDEIQDFEHDIRNAFGGAGFLSNDLLGIGTRGTPLGDPKAGLAPELDALAAYVASLARVPPSPHRAADGSPSASATAGEALFASLGCDGCHAAPRYTDSTISALLHDVGTMTPASGTRAGAPLVGLDTPTLRGAWNTAPYLHDGSAAELRDVFVLRNAAGLHGSTATLSEADLDSLVEFIRSIE